MKKTPETQRHKQAATTRGGLRLVTSDTENIPALSDNLEPKPQSKSSFVNMMDALADSLDAEIQKILDL